MDTHEIANTFNARAARYVRDDWHKRYADQLTTLAKAGDLHTSIGRRSLISRDAPGAAEGCAAEPRLPELPAIPH